MMGTAIRSGVRSDTGTILGTALGRRGVRARVVRARADELDILVYGPDRGRFEALLREQGFVAVPTPRAPGCTADRDRRFHVRDGLVVESMTSWAFDPAGGHSNRWILPGLTEAILDGAPGGPGPSGDAPLHLARVLHETVNRGGRRAESLRAALVALAAADPAGHSVRRFLGAAAAAAVDRSRAEALEGRSLDTGRLTRTLSNALRRNSLRRPMEYALRRVRDVVDRAWHRRLGRRQFAVALLGPDGVGKTTVAGLVASSDEIPRARWVYRYNGRPRISGLARVVRTACKGLFLVLERIAVGGSIGPEDLRALAEIRLRRFEGLLQVLGRRPAGNHLLDIVLLDRSTLDEAVELESDRARARARTLISRPMVGSEAFSILLSDDPHTIHARKDEKSVEEIAATLQRLRQGMVEFRSPDETLEMDIRGLSARDVARQVRDRIVNRIDREAGPAFEPPRASSGEPEIRFFVVGFPGPGAGVRDGVHRAVDGIADALARAGRRVVVIGQGTGTSHYRRSGYEVFTFEGPARFGLAPGVREWFATRREPGLTVLNGMFNPLVYSLSRVLKRRGMPYVLAPHDPYNEAIFATSRLSKAAWWWAAERRLLRDAESIQVLDPRHGAILRTLGVETPWFALPNGYRSEDFDEPHGPPPPHEGPARLYFLGRLDAHNKGLDLLIRVVAEEPDTVLTLQGPDWGDSAKLVELCDRLGVRDRVRVLEPAFDRSPGSLIAEHDVFCLVSRFEGFGLAALEAMLAERPVLVSDVGGLVSAVHASGCGTVVEPTVPSIRAGLRTLLDRRSQWPGMGAAGRAWAARHLTWEQVATDTWNVYEPLARPPGRP